jgi:preprotein translocase subunit YajC
MTSFLGCDSSQLGVVQAGALAFGQGCLLLVLLGTLCRICAVGVVAPVPGGPVSLWNLTVSATSALLVEQRKILLVPLLLMLMAMLGVGFSKQQRQQQQQQQQQQAAEGDAHQRHQRQGAPEPLTLAKKSADLGLLKLSNMAACQLGSWLLLLVTVLVVPMIVLLPVLLMLVALLMQQLASMKQEEQQAAANIGAAEHVSAGVVAPSSAADAAAAAEAGR